MKLLLDQGLPRSAIQFLSVTGIDALHVADIGMASADDPDILMLAQQTGRVVVTMDADFHAALALSEASSPSVIRVRIEGLKGEALVALLVNVLQRCESELAAGAMVTVTTGRVRIRMLPLNKSAPASN